MNEASTTIVKLTTNGYQAYAIITLPGTFQALPVTFTCGSNCQRNGDK